MKFFNNRQYWDFAARLGVSVAVLGSAFALGSVSVTSVRSLMTQKELEASDQPVTAQLDDSSAPVEKQIQNHEEILAKLQDPIAVDTTKEKLAHLYSELGKKSASLNEFPHTEMAYQKAINLDPSNPDYMADLASLYSERARRQRDASMRVTLYRSSRQYYRQAWQNERQPEVAQTYVNNAGATTLSLAKDLMATGRRTEVNEMLKEAESWATPDVIREINAILNR